MVAGKYLRLADGGGDLPAINAKSGKSLKINGLKVSDQCRENENDHFTNYPLSPATWNADDREQRGSSHSNHLITRGQAARRERAAPRSDRRLIPNPAEPPARAGRARHENAEPAFCLREVLQNPEASRPQAHHEPST